MQEVLQALKALKTIKTALDIFKWFKDLFLGFRIFLRNGTERMKSRFCIDINGHQDFLEAEEYTETDDGKENYLQIRDSLFFIACIGGSNFNEEMEERDKNRDPYIYGLGHDVEVFSTKEVAENICKHIDSPAMKDGRVSGYTPWPARAAEHLPVPRMKIHALREINKTLARVRSEMFSRKVGMLGEVSIDELRAGFMAQIDEQILEEYGDRIEAIIEVAISLGGCKKCAEKARASTDKSEHIINPVSDRNIGICEECRKEKTDSDFSS